MVDVIYDLMDIVDWDSFAKAYVPVHADIDPAPQLATEYETSVESSVDTYNWTAFAELAKNLAPLGGNATDRAVMQTPTLALCCA